MDTKESFENRIRGMIAEVVMGSLTFFCMMLDFCFPKKKRPHAMTQKDIADIVFREVKGSRNAVDKCR